MEKKNKIILGSFFIGGILIFAYRIKKKKPVKLDAVNKNIMSKFKKNNADFIAELNPAAKKTFTDFIQDIVNLGYAVVISSGYRSSSEQAMLKKQNSKNASPGYSTHEYGIGLDINLVKDGKWLNKNSKLADWRKTGIVDLAKKKYNMRWGGEFPGYSDPIHFDLGNKYNVVTLYAEALKKFGSSENIRGNTMTLKA